MPSVLEHYEKHLGPIYTWMAGGAENALARGRQELLDLGLLDCGAQQAVDLGAGFGMHAIPLARAGCHVLAVDSSGVMLEELRAQARGLPVTAVRDDLLNFPAHASGGLQIALCMGDTLTHLPDRPSVHALFQAVAESLSPQGTFIVSFRDYSRELEGPNRFIPVRSDGSRLLTCFLEYRGRTVTVHDIVHEWRDGAWGMRVSAYPKLRLEPDWVASQLESLDFAVEVGSGLSGLVRMRATKA